MDVIAFGVGAWFLVQRGLVLRVGILGIYLFSLHCFYEITLMRSVKTICF